MWVPLHNPVLVIVDAVDAAATRAFDPPGEDPGGFDDLLKQPSAYRDPVSGERRDAVQTVERQFLAQIEMDLEAIKRMTASGDIPDFDMVLVAHVRDLTRRGYVNADGSCTIQIGDRVREFQHPRRAEVMDRFDGNHTVWIDEVRSASWGFSGRRDLFLFFCTKKTEPI